MTSGIHHVTLISREVQANVDFYAGFLGLALVKQTAGYEDARQLHLFYGDPAGRPGSLISFLIWQDGGRGRVGHGQVADIALRVPQARIGDWLSRAMAMGVAVTGPVRHLGRTELRLTDPDGIAVRLTGDPGADAGPWPAPPQRLHGVSIWSETPEQTAAFLRPMGYDVAGRDGADQDGGVTILHSDTDVIEIRDASGFVPGIPGTGVADHVALRVPDLAALDRHESDLMARNSSIVNRHDRQYFQALYVREPGGTLIELATDGPGMATDEDAQSLGQRLRVPPGLPGGALALAPELPQFARPGQPRPPRRDLPFAHRLWVPPEGADDRSLILLHGSAGSEADLMPLAHRVSPGATLLALRGRATEDGTARFFRRPVDGRFEQSDIVSEAAALVYTLSRAQAGYGLVPAGLTVMGWSNGANLAAAAAMIHPGAIRRAVLLRPVGVLKPGAAHDVTAEQTAAQGAETGVAASQKVRADADAAPHGAGAQLDLTGCAVLIVAGRDDPVRAQTAALAQQMRDLGAQVDLRVVDGGHDLTDGDEDAARDWLAAQG